MRFAKFFQRFFACDHLIDSRHIRTKLSGEGKEICLTPEKILITNNCGMSVELSEQRGIKVKSNASVNIEASENIYISSSGASLEFAAANKIVFQQGNSTMELSDGIKLAGSTVKIQ